MQLYERVETGKRVSYRPYVPVENNMLEISQEQACAIMSTFTLAMLIRVTDNLPEHASVHRRVAKVQQAVAELAALNGPLDIELVDAGIAAWNAATRSMQLHLQGGAVMSCIKCRKTGVCIAEDSETADIVCAQCGRCAREAANDE